MTASPFLGTLKGLAQQTGIQKAPKSAWMNHIDPDWVQETLVGGLLDHWLKASVMPNGFIQENLDRAWKPWGTQREASLNGQGRQLYCMAAGYELTRRPDYLKAVHSCADFLMKMRDPEFGGYFNRVTPDFKVIDDTKTGIPASPSILWRILPVSPGRRSMRTKR